MGSTLKILITTSTVLRSSEARKQRSAIAHLVYADLIHRAGAIPVLLPNLHFEDAEDILTAFDGLLLTGGADVDPAQFGEMELPELGSVDQTRDIVELALARAAFKRDIPVLGICRGIQVIAVAAGGSLWQDIPTQLPENIGHNQTVGRAEVCHQVTVAADSQLGDILRAGTVGGDLRLGVNSFHHQATKLSGTLLPVAHSDDGVIEGLEARGARLIIGVQWHPEEMAGTNPQQNRLFVEFVRAASGK